jgi:hypothetical protein
MQPHLTRPWESFAFTFSIRLSRLIFPFCWWFPFWNGGYFKLACIYLCPSSFTMFYFPGGPSSMVYELYEWLRLFFEVCGHIVWSHVPPSISHWFFASRLLTLEEQYRGIHLIAIGDVTYCLVAHTLAIRFKDTLT